MIDSRSAPRPSAPAHRLGMQTLTGMPAAHAALCEVRYDTGLPYADLDAESLLGAPGAPGLLTLGTMWQYRNHLLRCARFEREAAAPGVADDERPFFLSRQSKSAHCEDCNDRNYVPPSPRALAALRAGLESAKRDPAVYR